MSDLGSHLGPPEEPSEHAQRGLRGHSSLIPADVVHQRTGLLTGWSCVIRRSRGTDVGYFFNLKLIFFLFFLKKLMTCAVFFVRCLYSVMFK